MNIKIYCLLLLLAICGGNRISLGQNAQLITNNVFAESKRQAIIYANMALSQLVPPVDTPQHIWVEETSNTYIVHYPTIIEGIQGVGKQTDVIVDKHNARVQIIGMADAPTEKEKGSPQKGSEK